MKISLAASLAAGLSLLGVNAALAECGPISIAAMNWQSGELLAYLDSYILSNGYGCEVEVIAGDTVPSITAMVEKGSPDIVPEAWVNSVPEIVNGGLTDGKIVTASEPLQDGGVQGIWVPRYFAEAHPDIKTIADALKHPDLFPDSEDPSRGAIVTAPQGWGAAIVMGQLAKAYGAEAAGFTVVDPGSAAGLDGSLVRAYERGEPWMGYYWSPTSMLGKYDMVRLDHGAAADDAEWQRCITNADCPDPKPVDWPRDKVLTLTTAEFSARAPEAMAYLKARTWPNTVVNEMSAWMTDEQATGQEGALHLLRTREDIWGAWVDPAAAAKIKAALGA